MKQFINEQTLAGSVIPLVDTTPPAYQLDDDGYPTDVVLEHLATTPNYRAALDLAQELWRWETMATNELTPAEAEFLMLDEAGLTDDNVKVWRLATGGWSGNESMIAALHRNTYVRAYAWRVSSSNGVHIYVSRRES